MTINNETSVKVKRTKYRTHKVSIAKCVYIAENAIVVSETNLADFEIARFSSQFFKGPLNIEWL